MVSTNLLNYFCNKIDKNYSIVIIIMYVFIIILLL
jgi:hypothetical protein